MISARLMKDLERRGFSLEFPSYSIEEGIIEILKTRNKRLYLALPLLIMEDFDYNKIVKKLDKDLVNEFNKILGISAKIFRKEGIKKNIKEKSSFNNSEFSYYYDSFKQSIKRRERSYEDELKDSINIRSKLNINMSLAEIFSPGKIRIMEKIFLHEKLTNTELKYYYRSIRPLIHSILNNDMQKYLRIIESSKKIS